MKCSETDINDALDCIVIVLHTLMDQLEWTLDEFKGWLSPLLIDAMPPWIV